MRNCNECYYHDSKFNVCTDVHAYCQKAVDDIRMDERITTVQFIIDEFNRRTVCLGRATAKNYVIDTLTEILNELKGQK